MMDDPNEGGAPAAPVQPKMSPQQFVGIGCAVVFGGIMLVTLGTCAVVLGSSSGSSKPTVPSPQSAGEQSPSASPPALSPPSAADLAKLPPELARRCDFADCPAGTKVTTASAKDGPFYSCQTEALSDYANTVLGLVAMQKQMTGTMPNVDPKTGEPVYQDQTEGMLTSLRHKAGVEAFDDAVAHCQFGPYKRTAIVMNFVRGRQSTWVSDSRTNAPFWAPTNEFETARR